MKWVQLNNFHYRGIEIARSHRFHNIFFRIEDEKKKKGEEEEDTHPPAGSKEEQYKNRSRMTQSRVRKSFLESIPRIEVV